MDEDDYTRITLRIPKQLHQQLVESSRATSKSMNAEIIDRLNRSFIRTPALSDEDISDILDLLHELVKQRK